MTCVGKPATVLRSAWRQPTGAAELAKGGRSYVAAVDREVYFPLAFERLRNITVAAT